MAHITHIHIPYPANSYTHWTSAGSNNWESADSNITEHLTVTSARESFASIMYYQRARVKKYHLWSVKLNGPFHRGLSACVFFLITEPYHLQHGSAWSCTTCSMVQHGEPYHLQPGTAWRAVPHAAWYCMHGEPYHMQHGTAWRAVPHAAWYCMESRTTCSMVLHGEPYHLQPGTAWRAVPPTAWYCVFL